jgi:chondroitin AC lyase
MHPLLPRLLIMVSSIAPLAASTPPAALPPDDRPVIATLDRATFVADPAGDAADLEVIRQRLRAAYLAERMPSAAAVAEMLSGLQPDGSFGDLDYVTVAPRGFPVAAHLRRLAQLALAYAKHPENHPEIPQKVAAGLTHWIKANPDTHHLWWVEIGAPLQLNRILILLQDQLEPDLVAACMPQLRRAYRHDAYFYSRSPATGANLTWVARIVLESAVLSGDAALAMQASQRLAEEIRVTSDEGIQSDYSFYQHGKQLYSGGYGSSFTTDCARVAAFLDGTRFALPAERVGLLVDFMLEGQRWQQRRGHWIYGARGREITRGGGIDRMETVTALLSLASVPRRGELEQLQRLLGDPVGNRHFWRSDLMTHHRPDWSASIRMASKRIFGTEGGNGENLLGLHLADGMLQLMKTGDEYHNLVPHLDWRKLPGTTVIQTDQPLHPLDWWGDYVRGASSFTGGVSNGEIGLAVFSQDRAHLRGRLVYSCFKDALVLAGAALEVPADNPFKVTTSLDQRVRRGPVEVVQGDELSIASEGESSLLGPVWVVHDGIGYFIPAGQQATLLLETRNEPWSRVTRSSEHPGAAPASAAIFALWLDHGRQPAAGFYSVVLPATSAAALMADDAAFPQPIAVIADLIAFDDGQGNRAYAFFGPGAAPDASLALDSPGLALLVDGSLTVSDPAGARASLAVRMPAAGPVRHVALPREHYAAGSSVQVDLSSVPDQPTSSSHPVASSSRAVQSLAPAGFVSLPAGRFLRGDSQGDADEQPVAEVALSAFSLAPHPVTRAEWNRVYAWAVERGYSFRRGPAPAEQGDAALVGLIWYDAVKWCNARSEMEGRQPVYFTDAARSLPFRSGHLQILPEWVDLAADGYRLPTEAEWEYAARLQRIPASVIASSLSEWCFDFYGGYEGLPQQDPLGPADGFDRTRRGGSQLFQSTGTQRPSFRLPDDPASGRISVTLRLASSAHLER